MIMVVVLQCLLPRGLKWNGRDGGDPVQLRLRLSGDKAIEA